MQQPQPTQVPSNNAIPAIPEGFVLINGPNKYRYIVPRFMVPAVEHCNTKNLFEEYLNVVSAAGGALQVDNTSFDCIAADQIMFPPDPELSEQEYLLLHAEVVALQTQLGISYKDAAHRLYMTNVEKLKLADATHKTMKTLHHDLQTSLATLAARLNGGNGDNDVAGKTGKEPL